MYIDAFEGGFLSALAAHGHYSVAVGCLWGCSQAENRANETGRSEVVAIDLPEGSIVDRKSRQFKRTPGASFSARHAKEWERDGKCGRVEIGTRLTRTSNYAVTKCLQRDYCQRHLAPRVTGASVDLSCIINFIRPKDPQTAGSMSFVDGNNVTRVRHHVA